MAFNNIQGTGSFYVCQRRRATLHQFCRNVNIDEIRLEFTVICIFQNLLIMVLSVNCLLGKIVGKRL